MNKFERLLMVKSMEFICRNLNDERDIDYWLTMGVADGDIPYGDFDTSQHEIEENEFYLENDNFADLMHTFLMVMKNAYKGGFYCDGVLSQRTI